MKEAKEFISLLTDAIEKAVFTIPVENEEYGNRIQMYARGEFKSGTRYRKGDVVSVVGGGVYVCIVEDTIDDPRSNTKDWMILTYAQAIGGIYNGGSTGPVAPTFSYIGKDTGDGDNNLRNFETAILKFNEPVNFLTMTLPKDANNTPIPGIWVAVGNNMVFTPTVSWQSYTGPYTINTAGVTAVSGATLSTATTVVFVEEQAFNFVSFSTGDNDNDVRDKEALILNFDALPNLATLAYPKASNGSTILGTWTLSGNSASFVPTNNWQDYLGPYTFDMAGATGASGALVDNPTVITIQMEAPPNTFALVSAITGDGDNNVRDQETIEVSFSEAIVMSSLPDWEDANGAIVAGTWSSTATGYLFTPSANWQDLPGPFTLDLNGFTSSAGQPITNPQVVFIPLEAATPPQPFSFTGSSVESGATAIAGTKERITSLFSRNPSITSVLSNAIVTRTDTGAAIPGFWAFNGNEVLFTPNSDWPSLPTVNDKFRFTFTGVVADDDAAGLIGVDFDELDLIVFNWISSSTGENDNLLYEKETLDLTFDSPPDLATLPPVLDNNGTPFAGNWSVSGNVATFTPTLNWQSGQSPTTVDTTNVLSSTGVINSNANIVTTPIGAYFVKVSHSPSISTALSGSQPLTVTFNLPVDASSMPSVLQDNVSMPGTWTASGNTATFTPSEQWNKLGVEVILSWAHAVATDGQSVLNSGSVNYTTATALVMTGSSPASGSFINHTAAITLYFNIPVVASSLAKPTVAGLPIDGNWSILPSGAARFRSFAPLPIGGTLEVNYASAMSTGGLPVDNPGSVILTVTKPIAYVFSVPAINTLVTGQRQILLGFDAEPLLSSLPTPNVIVGITPTPIGGSWAVSGNSAVFTPTDNWLQGTLIINTSSVMNVAGQTISNPSTLQWVSM